MTFLNTKEDLDWLQEVHKMPVQAGGYVCAILYGNEDAPSKVELFVRDHYKCKPTVYESDDTGTLRLKEFGEKPPL